jgi:hypothetical protein
MRATVETPWARVNVAPISRPGPLTSTLEVWVMGRSDETLIWEGAKTTKSGLFVKLLVDPTLQYSHRDISALLPRKSIDTGS